MRRVGHFITVSLLILLSACSHSTLVKHRVEHSQSDHSKFTQTLMTLLDSVEERDLEKMQSSLSPNGNMQLSLPNMQTTYTVEEFIEFHRNWFKNTNWSMEHKIINTEIGHTIGVASVEAIYREPERNGKPYVNHIAISYVLQKVNDDWYVIKDHASWIKQSNE